MCQKQILKKFFILVNHPTPLQKPYVLGIVKPTAFSNSLFEKTRNTVFLEKKEVESLGFQPPKALQAYLLSIQIPRDWFLH